MNKFNYWPVTLKWIVVIICFTILSVVFNRWWIVLFTLLLGQSYQEVVRPCITCDKCADIFSSTKDALNFKLLMLPGGLLLVKMKKE